MTRSAPILTLRPDQTDHRDRCDFLLWTLFTIFLSETSELTIQFTFRRIRYRPRDALVTASALIINECYAVTRVTPEKCVAYACACVRVCVCMGVCIYIYLFM